MKEKVVMNVARTEHGYSCVCDLLPGWIVSHEGTFEAFKREVEDSIAFYVECAKADGRKYAAVLDGTYELVYSFDVESVLCYLRGLMTFAALERITGINQKQLAHYASGRSKPRAEQRRKIDNGLRQFATELSSVTVY